MDAGEEGIAALDAVNQADSHQKVPRAVDRVWRRAGRHLRQIVNEFIGSERYMTCEQRLQHPPADGREFLPPRLALPLRMGHRIGRTAAMVVVWGRKGRCERHGSACIAAMLRSIALFINNLCRLPKSSGG